MPTVYVTWAPAVPPGPGAGNTRTVQTLCRAGTAEFARPVRTAPCRAGPVEYNLVVLAQTLWCRAGTAE